MWGVRTYNDEDEFKTVVCHEQIVDKFQFDQDRGDPFSIAASG